MMTCTSFPRRYNLSVSLQTKVPDDSTPATIKWGSSTEKSSVAKMLSSWAEADTEIKTAIAEKRRDFIQRFMKAQNRNFTIVR
jgi:hypothetical protein